MIQTVEAVIDSEGRMRLLGEIHVSGPRRALVTVLEEPAVIPGETTLLALPNVPPVEPQDEWERKLFGAAIDCCVSVPNSALSSDGLYDEWLF